MRAVLFDWGGTITPFHNVDMLDGWLVAAKVLAPERADEVAEALLAAEREIWARTTSTLRSATTAEVLRNAGWRVTIVSCGEPTARVWQLLLGGTASARMNATALR